MTDLSKLSDAELQALYSKPQGVAGMSDAELMAAYQQSVPVTTEGLAKAGGTGVVKGALGLADLMTEATPALKALKQSGLFSPTQQGMKAIESITGGLHQPQNTPERYAETIGEFLPGSVGPGGVIRQAANLGRGILAGGASEAAGQATEALGGGEKAQQAARIAAALAAPMTATRRGVGSAAPTREELYKAADEGYATLRNSGAEYKLSSVSKLADDIKAGLEETGFSARTAGRTHDVLDALKNAPPGAASVTAKGLEQARQELGQIARDPAQYGKASGAAARVAVDRIGEFLGRADPRDVAPGLGKTALEGQTAAEIAARAVGPARANYAAASRSEAVGARDYNAGLQAGAAHSGANADNALRQNVKALLRQNDRGISPAQRAGFNKEEIAALEKFVAGSTSRNTVRTVSNVLGGGGGLGAAALGLGGAITGGPGGLAIASGPVLGALLKLGQNRAARKALERIDEEVRHRSPLGAGRIPPEERIAAIIRALQSSGSGLSSR